MCSVGGNPESSSTWSGTPANLCRELKRLGRLGPTFESGQFAGARVQRLVNFASRRYYGTDIDYTRGILHRYLRARRLRGRLRKTGARDVLHTGSLDLPLPGPDALTRHYLFCDATWHSWSRYAIGIDQYPAKLLRDAERLEQRAYEQMTHVFPISEHVKQDLVEHYKIDPSRITVVGTGRGAIKPYHGPKDYSAGKVLFVAKGRFKDKGGDILLEGFRLASKSRPALELTVVGDEQYKSLIGTADPNIKVFGYVALEQLQEFFEQASLFAMPAVNEPWGLVYLEALSCKTPVLGLARNALPEITGRGAYGFCLANGTATELADALIEAYDHPDRLAEMGARGQAHCLERFDWAATVRRIVDAIDAV